MSYSDGIGGAPVPGPSSSRYIGSWRSAGGTPISALNRVRRGRALFGRDAGAFSAPEPGRSGFLGGGRAASGSNALDGSNARGRTGAVGDGKMEFVDALEDIFQRRSIPKPATCSEVRNLPQFFKQYERYALTHYGRDMSLWFLGIGEFVSGEVEQIVNSFGGDVDYLRFKERVNNEFVREEKVTGESYKNILELKRNIGESLRCFRLRAEGKVNKIETREDNRKALLLCALRNNVNKDVLTQIDLQLSSTPDYSVSKFLDIFEAVDRTLGNRPQQFASDSVINVVGSGREVDQKVNSVICYNCDQPGHISRDCSLPRKCFKCKNRGHFAKDCPQNQAPKQYSRGETECSFCGGKGHIMKGCTEFRDMLMSINGNGVHKDGRLN